MSTACIALEAAFQDRLQILRIVLSTGLGTCGSLI